MSALAILGALAIGLALGLTGAGGSILTFPVLVYLADVSPRDAVAMSLFVVATTALAGAVQRAAKGDLHVPAAGWFSISGIPGAWIGAQFTHMLSASALIALFATIMMVVGLRMWLGKSDEARPVPNCKPLRCFIVGAGVGLLTGFLGVGGGFLLLPALTRFARLPIRMATGTSLAIIAFNAYGGFFSHLSHAVVDWWLTWLIAAVATGFAWIGGIFADQMHERLLKRCFASVVLITAVGMMVALGYGFKLS